MMRLVMAVLGLASVGWAQEFDVVIANGRVMDPASGLDAVRNIGIRGDKIAAISADALHGRIVLDAKGLVVAPGFIDLHSHGQTPVNYGFKAMDGVTTALEMEVGCLARIAMVCRTGRPGTGQLRRLVRTSAGAHGCDARQRHAAAAR